MAIVGIGTDIVEIARLEGAIERHGEGFLRQFLTEPELALIPELPQRRREFLAGRWAAKEAVAKALGCGFGARCGWHDIRILRGDAGEPRVELTGTAAETARDLGVVSWHLSISHEKTFAVAFAVAEL